MQPVKSICSNSEDRSAIMPGWNLHIKVKFCAATHTGSAFSKTCPFRKQMIRCSHQLHNRAYRTATRLRCGGIFWMKAGRGSDHNNKKKEVKNGMNAQLRGKNPTHRERHTRTHTHTGADPLNRVCATRRWTQRPSPPATNPGPAFLFAAIRGSSGHTRTKPLTWLMCWRTAFYLRTTSGLQASLCLLIGHRTCCIVETISGAYNRQKNMQYYCLYQTKPSALGQHLFATRTHSLSPFHTHTHG